MDALNSRHDLERLAEMAKSTFWGYLGCELVSMEERRVVIALDVKEHHLNLIGILHGGVHASLLDSAMGLVAMNARPGENVVTSTINVHFTAPVQMGRVTVVGEILHMSGKMITAQGTLTSGDNVLCAAATASFRVIEKK